MSKRFGKTDILFISIITLIVFIIFLFMFFINGKSGSYALVTVNGTEYGRYSLNENQQIDIVIDNKTTNTLIIEDGKANMIEADCPDKLCVHQKSISLDKESIVCLPNKVVITIISDDKSDIDAVAQ